MAPFKSGLLAAGRKRLNVWGVAAVIGLVVAGWIGYINLGPARFIPPPFSEVTAAPVGGDWPMFQRDPAHSAFVTGESAVPTGRLKWRFEVRAPIFSSPAIVGNRVYLSTGDGRVLALDAASGDLIWEHKVGAPVNSSPAVAGDLVYVGLRDGRVVALTRDAGEKLWEFKTGEPVYSSPTVYQGVLYIGSTDARLYALDATTGTERWSYLTGGRLTSGPAVNQEVTAVVSQNRRLYLIDNSTGKRRLDFRTSLVKGSPAIHENYVFVADENGAVRAIDWRERLLPFEIGARRVITQLYIWGMVESVPRQRGFVWGFQQSGERFVGTPAVGNDTVYVGSASGTLFALDESTGEQRWQYSGEAAITTSPSIAGQTVFFGDEDGRLYSINALTGDLQWRFIADAPISSTPVIASGTLYFTSLGGTLYAVD